MQIYLRERIYKDHFDNKLLLCNVCSSNPFFAYSARLNWKEILHLDWKYKFLNQNIIPSESSTMTRSCSISICSMNKWTINQHDLRQWVYLDWCYTLYQFSNGASFQNAHSYSTAITETGVPIPRRPTGETAIWCSWTFPDLSMFGLVRVCFHYSHTCACTAAQPAAGAGAVCLPVPGVGHGSHGLFQALPTLYVQQHILLVTLKGSSFSQVVPL